MSGKVKIPAFLAITEPLVMSGLANNVTDKGQKKKAWMVFNFQKILGKELNPFF